MDLVACGKCSRQYDVTHLEIGSLIRCFCDTVTAVPARRPLSVSTLACNNCGGKVRPDHDTCPYCEATLDPAAKASTTLCPKCFTRIPDDARHCNGCGIEIRPQALTPIPDGKTCPRCRGPLQIRALGISDVIECGSCEGIWIRSGAFLSICRSAALSDQVPLPDWPKREGTEPPAQPSGSFYISCLICNQLMQRRQFHHGGRGTGVILDLCRSHGVWLDHRELEDITTHIRARGGAIEPLFEVPKTAAPKLTLGSPSARIIRSPVETALDFVLSHLFG